VVPLSVFITRAAASRVDDARERREFR